MHGMEIGALQKRISTHTGEKLQEIEKTFDVSSDREQMAFGKVNVAVAVQKKSFCPSPLYLCR